MELQEIFTRVKDHLLKQGVKSAEQVEGVTRCLYRDECENSCAIGSLIKDEFYHKDMEQTALLVSSYIKLCTDYGETNRHAALRKALENSIGPIGLEEIRLLKELQCVHDSSVPEDWEEELKRVALNNSLEY